MANKKKASRSNKKKGKGASRGTSTTRPAPQGSQHGDMAGGLPTVNSRDTVSSLDTEGIYGRYKECTRDFWEWMKRALPGSKMVSVNDLSRGVDQILEDSVQVLNSDRAMESLEIQPLVAPRHIINRLTRSIKLRERFSTYYADKLDTGHEHMISTLIYCKEVLLFSRRILQVAFNDSREQAEKLEVNESEVGGRFHAFLGEDDEEEGVDVQFTDDDIRSRKLPSFQQPTQAEREMNIKDDLINGDDRFQAIAMLQSMEDFMATVAEHYNLLNSYMKGEKAHSGSRIQKVMECAMVANLATDIMLSIERGLALAHPHLDSFYRVLALVLLPSLVADVHRQISPAILANSPHLALHFVGDVVECCFRNRSNYRVLLKVGEYVERSGIRRATLEELAEQVVAATQFEVVLAHEEKQRPHQKEVVRTAGVSPHSLFTRSPHIGGDRSILNTHNEFQILMDVIKDGTRIWSFAITHWGLPNGNITMVSRVQGENDEGFVANILPELVKIFRDAKLTRLPESSQLLTVPYLLATQLKHQSSPIPIALTFGLHAVLTSMYILQGEGHLFKTAQALKVSFNKLFVQLGVRSDREREPKSRPEFYEVLDEYRSVFDRIKPLGPLDPRENVAIWNPVIGGEYLLYATYICSVLLGSCTVDSMGQLRCTLHLYNALKQQGLVSEKDTPLLERLDKIFAGCRAVWVGSRPEKGAYARQFRIAGGRTLIGASLFERQVYRSMQESRMNTRRQPETIRPEEFCACYKLLVQRNFKESCAENSTRNATDEQRELFTSSIDLLTMINMTRDSMDDDKEWVFTNFTEVGCILLEFCNLLSKELGWESIVEMRRKGRVGNKLPNTKGFETSVLNLRVQQTAFGIIRLLSEIDMREVVEVTRAHTAAECMKLYFKGVPKSKYTFAVEVEDGEPELEGNPLEGATRYITTAGRALPLGSPPPRL